MIAALNHCRFVDQQTAHVTLQELAHSHAVELAPGIVLHVGEREGVPTFVVDAGAGGLSAVIACDLAEE